MIKTYKNFMYASLNNGDKYCVNSYLCDNDFNAKVYSKIVVQFDDEDSYMNFQKDKPDTDTFVLCHDWNNDAIQYILYTIDENAFDDICELMSKYDCDVLQFILEY